jgi:flavin-dependent dehydrogenase
MAQEMKHIHIVGGGLAGLALGIALRRREVPVTVHEALSYPRHRVCGEFISGVSGETLRKLGIEKFFATMARPQEVAWCNAERELGRFALPEAAYALSRFSLDQELCAELRALGGEVIEKSRQQAEPREGWVWSAGRRPTNGSWIGLKAHVRGFSLKAGLEMHLGAQGYVGLVEVEDGWINVCGLFHLDSSITSKNAPLLLAYLRREGLEKLVARLQAAEWREGSISAVAGFRLGWQPALPSLMSVGDAHSIIPPFTGNGMSMALEGAALAIEPLVAYASGRIDWPQAQQALQSSSQRKFDHRLRWAMVSQRLLLAPWFRKPLEILAQQQLLPFHTLFTLTRR